MWSGHSTGRPLESIGLGANATSGNYFAPGAFKTVADPQCAAVTTAQNLSSFCTLNAVMDTRVNQIVLQNPLPGHQDAGIPHRCQRHPQSSGACHADSQHQQHKLRTDHRRGREVDVTPAIPGSASVEVLRKHLKEADRSVLPYPLHDTTAVRRFTKSRMSWISEHPRRGGAAQKRPCPVYGQAGDKQQRGPQLHQKSVEGSSQVNIER